MYGTKNICVSSQLDDFLMSSAPDQGFGTSNVMASRFDRRNSRLSNNLPNYNHGGALNSNRGSQAVMPMNSNSSRPRMNSIASQTNARKAAIAAQANQANQ